MSTYTKNNLSIHFLNDRNIASSLTDDIKFNPIPSLHLLSTVNDRIENLNLQDKINNGQGIIISSLEQVNGQLIYGTRQILTNDINDFNQEVNDRIDLKINTLSTNDIYQENCVVISVHEENGKVYGITSKITQNFIDGQIDQSKIYGLINDLSNISSNYELTANFKKDLSSSFTQNDFRYDKTEHTFHLNVCGNDLTINAKEIIEGQIIKRAYIDTSSGEPEIVIVFDAEETEPIRIKIKEFVKLYKIGDGLTLNDNYDLSVNDTIARTAFVQSISSEFRTDIDSIKNINWETLKFNRHIGNDDIDRIRRSNYVSSFIQQITFDTDKLLNGSVINVKFNDDTIFASTLSDGFCVGNGDYVIIHDHNSKAQELEISSLVNGYNVFILKAGVSKYEFTNLSSELCTGLCSTYNTLTSTISSISSDLTVQISSISSDLDDRIKKSQITCFVVSSLEDISSYGNGGLSVELSTLNTGTVAIVSSYIAGTAEQRKAYVWNKDNTPEISGRWEAFDGNYSAENIYFSKDMNFAGDYTLGNKKTSKETTIKYEAGLSSLQTIMFDMFSQRKDPTVTKPKYTFAINSYTKSKEVGEKYVVPGVKFTYSDSGTYQYNTPQSNTGVSIDIGQATISCLNGSKSNDSVMVVGNSIDIANGVNDIYYKDSSESYVYLLSAHHLSGNAPLDNLGGTCLSLAIKADEWNGQSVTNSLTATFQGYRKFFWGCLSPKKEISDMNSDTIRTLPYNGSSFPVNGSDFSISAGSQQYVFAAPVSKGWNYKLKPKDAAGDYTGFDSEKSTLKVQVCGSNNYDPKDYDIWSYSPATGEFTVKADVKINWEK